MNDPAGLAFDARGDLFAANGNGTNITEFGAGTTPGPFGAGMTVETGLNGAEFLAFGPSVSAPVPEASTTASFGLPLAQGMGGLALRSRRRTAQQGGLDKGLRP